LLHAGYHTILPAPEDYSDSNNCGDFGVGKRRLRKKKGGTNGNLFVPGGQ
jgi:hypothetical protein